MYKILTTFIIHTLLFQSVRSQADSAIIGKINGITIQVKVQGPGNESTPLQVACVFEYTRGDIFNPPALPAAINGMVHLDQALHGEITKIRESGKFAGHSLETLLMMPSPGLINAEKLLLVGLGDRAVFAAQLMTRIGSFLAGPAYFKDACDGIRTAMNYLNNQN